MTTTPLPNWEFEVCRKSWNCRKYCFILPVLRKTFTAFPMSSKTWFYSLRMVLGQGKWCHKVRTKLWRFLNFRRTSRNRLKTETYPKMYLGHTIVLRKLCEHACRSTCIWYSIILIGSISFSKCILSGKYSLLLLYNVNTGYIVFF